MPYHTTGHLGVELVGIEPTSEQDGDKPSTCVVYY